MAFFPRKIPKNANKYPKHIFSNKNWTDNDENIPKTDLCFGKWGKSIDTWHDKKNKKIKFFS